LILILILIVPGARPARA